MLKVDDPRKVSCPKMSLRLPSMIPGCVDSCQHIYYFFGPFQLGWLKHRIRRGMSALCGLRSFVLQVDANSYELGGDANNAQTNRPRGSGEQGSRVASEKRGYLYFGWLGEARP